MLVHWWLDYALRVAIGCVLAFCDPSSAAPEWQAKILGWRSRNMQVACPLEGLVGLSRSAADSTQL
jgi:hypothetical protein